MKFLCAFIFLIANSCVALAQQQQHRFENEFVGVLLGLLLWVGIPVGLFLLIKHRAKADRTGTTVTGSIGIPANQAGGIANSQAGTRVLPAVPDSEGAVEDMRLARSYLKDWWDKKAPDSVLGHAARYIEKARAKDPIAKLSTEETVEGKKVVSTYTIDDLAGWCLFYTAQAHYNPNDKRSLEAARDTLKKAIEYCPYSVQYREWLADACLDLHDKQSALAVAREAVERNPRDLDARKLLDRIEAAPVTHPPAPVSNSTIVHVIGIVFALVAVISLFNGYFSNFFMFAVFGAIAFFIAASLSKSEMLQKAMDAKRAESERKRRGR